MADIRKLVQKHVLDLGAYVPGKPVRQAERESGIRCIKMASNENPFGPSPKALAAMRDAAEEANFYPDNDAAELRADVAARHAVAPENVIVTDGSTAMLDVIARTVLAPGLKAITSERSFIVYPIATRVAGAELVTVPMRDDTFDLQAIAAAIDHETRLIFIANPNNPTGTLLPADEVERFLDRVPEHVLVVLDEAYCDFASEFAKRRHVEYSGSLEHVRAGRPNVVVLRTFSKAHGLAGARVGYALGVPELIQHFARVRPPFSISGVAEAAARAALGDTEHIRKAVENNTACAPELERRLADLGYRVVPTSANFIYFEVDEDAGQLSRRMQQAGVIVRSLAPWGIPHGVRVTIGTPEQNEQFIAALQQVRQHASATRR